MGVSVQGEFLLWKVIWKNLGGQVMRVKKEVPHHPKCKVATTNTSNVFSGVLCFFPNGRGLGVLEFDLHELGNVFFS